MAQTRQVKDNRERDRKKGKDGSWLYGPHEDEYCDVHKAYAHRTLDCRRPKSRTNISSRLPVIEEEEDDRSHTVGTFVASRDPSALRASSLESVLVTD